MWIELAVHITYAKYFLIEIMPHTFLQMEVDEKPKGEGVRQYYITKIEELQLIVAEKSQNLRRLQAQRNELNAKGICFGNFRRLL